MQHVHILCWLQQNGLHSLTRSWGLLLSEGRLHESDNKICWYLMHLKRSHARSPHSLCPLFQRLEQITIASMNHCTKQHMGNMEMTIKRHKQTTLTCIIPCCFCSKLVNIMLTCLRDGQPSPKEFASWAITGAADTNNGYHYTHSVLIHDTFWPKQYFLQKMSQPAGHDTGLESFNDSWIWFNPWSSRFFTQ